MSRKGSRFTAADVKYSVGDFKTEVDYGAASQHDRHSCLDCAYYGPRRHRPNDELEGRTEECRHPSLHVPFSLGTHPDRMGCKRGFKFWGNAP